MTEYKNCRLILTKHAMPALDAGVSEGKAAAARCLISFFCSSVERGCGAECVGERVRSIDQSREKGGGGRESVRSDFFSACTLRRTAAYTDSSTNARAATSNEYSLLDLHHTHRSHFVSEKQEKAEGKEERGFK
jgi:hypothetical protein